MRRVEDVVHGRNRSEGNATPLALLQQPGRFVASQGGRQQSVEPVAAGKPPVAGGEVRIRGEVGQAD